MPAQGTTPVRIRPTAKSGCPPKKQLGQNRSRQRRQQVIQHHGDGDETQPARRARHLAQLDAHHHGIEHDKQAERVERLQYGSQVRKQISDDQPGHNSGHQELNQKPVDELENGHGETSCLPVRSSKTLDLSGAVTDLEDGHSMALEGFFDFFGQHGLDQGQGSLRIVIQGNLQNPTNLLGFKLKLDRFEIHGLSPTLTESFR